MAGAADGVAQKRFSTLAAARVKHPDRFGTATDPKILAVPALAWTNEPIESTEKQQPNGCLTHFGTVSLEKFRGLRPRGET